SCSSPHRSRLGVDPELQALARLERQHLSRGDLDAVTGLGIAAAARRLLADPEMAEADDLHIFPLLEAAEDDVEQRFHHRSRLPLGQPVSRHRVDQSVLGQRRHLPSSGYLAGPCVTKPACPLPCNSSRAALAFERSGKPPTRTTCSVWSRFTVATCTAKPSERSVLARPSAFLLSLNAPTCTQ